MVESQNQSVAVADTVSSGQQPDESENQNDFSSDSVNNESEL